MRITLQLFKMDEAINLRLSLVYFHLVAVVLVFISKVEVAVVAELVLCVVVDESSISADDNVNSTC